MVSLTLSLAEQSEAPASPSKPSPVEVFLASQGNPHTRRAFRQALERAARSLFENATPHAIEHLPWTDLRYHDLERLTADLLAHGYSISTVNVTIAALRGLMRHARRLRLVSADDFQDIREVRRAAGTSLPAGRALSTAEVGKLFSAAHSLPRGLRERDLALLAIAFSTGARRAEIAALDLGDLSTTDRTVLVRAGKGGRPRRVHLTEAAVQHLVSWIAVREPARGPLLCPVDGRRAVRLGERLTAGAIYRRFSVLGQAAGLDAVSPHDARRTVATQMLAAGVDLNTVAAQTGHASLQVLRRYDRRGEGFLRKAVADTLQIPTAGATTKPEKHPDA